MMKGFVAEENMSNLTSASGEVSASSGSNLYTQQHSFSSTNEAPPPASPPSKKKRSLPGNPDPDAEVVALSPKSLMATNRFLCEICNKGFQRDQNLQLHRRGHNLPWKLKQRSANKVERKKVYVCPEPACVHHDPSRALGDLTGIKKHFFRKHGEKKWKCEKCSKKYAVQSDWKAHSKICGTREYKCDCGKIFSRRDSFITHRAFCDVLAEESGRAITTNPILISSSNQQQQQNAHHMFSYPSHNQLQLQSQGLQILQAVKREDQDHHHRNNNMIPPWLAACPSSLDLSASSQLFSPHSHNGNPSPSLNTNPNSTSSFGMFGEPTISPHTSATALLQKAAQMGATMSSRAAPVPSSALPASMLGSVAVLQPQPQPHQQTHHMSTAGSSSGLGLSSRDHQQELASGAFVQNFSSFGNAKAAAAANSAYMEQFAASNSSSNSGGATLLLNDIMNMGGGSLFDRPSTDNNPNSSSFDEALNGMLMSNNPRGYNSDFAAAQHEITRGGGGNGGGIDGLSTRDFLGLKSFPQRDFINIAGIGHHHMNNPPPSSSTSGHQNQNPGPWIN